MWFSSLRRMSIIWISRQQVSEIYKSRKEMIQKDNIELEMKIAPVYESRIAEIESMMLNVAQKHQERQQTIAEFGERCHNVVTRVVNKYLNDSQEIEKEDNDSLLALKSEFESKRSSIQSAISQNNSILASSDSSKFIHYNSTNEHFKNVPYIFELTVQQIHPGELTEHDLCQIIGDIPRTIKNEKQGNTLLQGQIMPERQFNVKPKIIESVNAGYGNTYGVKCIPNTNQFYVWGNSPIIKHMTTDGKVLEEIHTSGGIPLHLTFTIDGYLVYTEVMSKKIYRVKKGNREHYTLLQEWTPVGIFATTTVEVLVAMKFWQNGIAVRKLVRYPSILAIQDIQYGAENEQAVYTNPVYIEENKNHDIIVSDSDTYTLVVLNTNGMFKFNYNGNHLLNRYHKSFAPRGVTTNSMCQILIADCTNNIIHIIDCNGQFLSFIANNELHAPINLSTDSNDNLLVAEYLSGSEDDKTV